jgi:hypothetical protein
MALLAQSIKQLPIRFREKLRLRGAATDEINQVNPSGSNDNDGCGEPVPHHPAQNRSRSFMEKLQRCIDQLTPPLAPSPTTPRRRTGPQKVLHKARRRLQILLRRNLSNVGENPDGAGKPESRRAAGAERKHRQVKQSMLDLHRQASQDPPALSEAEVQAKVRRFMDIRMRIILANS